MRFGLQAKAVLLLLGVTLVPLGAALLLEGQVGRVAGRVAAGEAARLREPLERASGAYREAVDARKDAFRAQAALWATHADLATACAGQGVTRAPLEALLDGEPMLGRASLEVASGERAIATREFDEPVRTLELTEPVLGVPGCSLRLVFGFPARLLDEHQALGQVLKEQRYVARVRRTLPGSSWKAFAALLGGVVATAVVIGIFVARRTNRRIAELAEGTRRIADGDLDSRVVVGGRDELTDLAQAMNTMIDELRRSRAEIEYLQKIGAWQEVARRLAHEIKNPLTPIQLAVQQLRSTYDGSDARFKKTLEAASEIVEEEVAGLRRLVDAFSGFAKLPRVEARPLDLAVVVDDVARDADDVTLSPPPTPIEVSGDRLLLRRALSNLVDNAREAGAKRVALAWRREGETATLTVDDDGPGVPAGLRARVFDPYVTGKEHGTGLGLAIVKKTLLEHEGDVELAAGPSPLGGARFVLTLPTS
jgi:nitrogen fixation/metabolism regulation signal transduction histidine kinase